MFYLLSGISQEPSFMHPGQCLNGTVYRTSRRTVLIHASAIESTKYPWPG